MGLTQAEVHHVLYEDEAGQEIGLDEVQLLDPPPSHRIPLLEELLHHEDPVIAYEAALVLAAWGHDAGLNKIEELIDSRIHERGELSPHRIHGYDNVYDELAYAVHLNGLSGGVQWIESGSSASSSGCMAPVLSNPS